MSITAEPVCKLGTSTTTPEILVEDLLKFLQDLVEKHPEARKLQIYHRDSGSGRRMDQAVFHLSVETHPLMKSFTRVVLTTPDLSGYDSE